MGEFNLRQKPGAGQKSGISWMGEWSAAAVEKLASLAILRSVAMGSITAVKFPGISTAPVTAEHPDEKP